MMRCGEKNHHVHDGYEKRWLRHRTLMIRTRTNQTIPSCTIFFEEPSAENIIIEESESECKIANETSSQSNSSDVPTNAITELNYADHIEPSENVEEESYFNIFECGRNLLDKLDVTS